MVSILAQVAKLSPWDFIDRIVQALLSWFDHEEVSKLVLLAKLPVSRAVQSFDGTHLRSLIPCGIESLGSHEIDDKLVALTHAH